MNKDKIQQLQEEEYSFPYHYVTEYKNGFTQNYNFPWGINYAATIEFLLNKLKEDKFNSIVDIGCGDGKITRELKNCYQDKHIIGIDYSQNALEFARAFNPDIKFYCQDISSSSIENSFDIAFLIEVLEHISLENAEDFIKGVSKILNNEGKLFLTVPHINQALLPKHYRHYTVNTLIKNLEGYFDILEIILFEKISWRKKFIDLLLNNKLYILNSQSLKDRLYSYYKKHLFYVKNEQNCKRIFIKAKVKK